MAKEKFNEEDGVWRTIGGRRVFIRKGQSMSEAMKESGKFKSGKKEETKEEKTKVDKNLEEDIQEEETNKKQDISKKLDQETEDLSDYDKYNLAVSKLEDAGEMQPEEKKYWEKVKNEYQNNALGKQMKDADKNTNTSEDNKKSDLKNAYDEYVKKTLSNEDYLRENRPNEHLNNLINESKEKRNGSENLSKEEDTTKSAEEKGAKYRNDISNVAKNSKEDNVTLDIETGEPVNFEKGYSVSFQQSTDAYDDNEYYEKVEECRNKCDGKVYAGKYGGDAEVSFHTDNLDDAKEIMYKYNQESIWDWQHETLIMNDKYDASKNQTNYKEEKTTNEIMNNAIREKAGKNKVKEDLPQKTEIKTQGTSNRKEVSENIQAHILDYYDSPDDFIQQMDNMNAPTMWHAGERLAKGGSYMVYYDEQREFLDSLKINPKGKRFSDDRVFNTYTSLVGRESAKLYDRLQRNAYKKYLKEHPGSEMSLTEFKNMRKGE